MRRRGTARGGRAEKKIDETCYLSGRRRGAVLKEEVWYEGRELVKYAWPTLIRGFARQITDGFWATTTAMAAMSDTTWGKRRSSLSPVTPCSWPAFRTK